MGAGEFEPANGSMHAANAGCAAYHYADVATNYATSLAQWVQYLSATLNNLQYKVNELEDWKKRALEDVRKLRDEHKMLKRRVVGDESASDSGLPGRSKSHSTLGSPTASESSSSKSTPARPPPGLEFSLDTAGVEVSKDESSTETSASTPCSPAATTPKLPSSYSFSSDYAGTEHDLSLLEGVHVSVAAVEGVPCERAEWRIGHLSSKLRGCMGRALVSSPFDAAGLKDLRLMVCPGRREGSKGPRSRRQKELYARKVMEGPLDGCLKLKVPDCPENRQLEFYLVVGPVRKGPMKHNFAENTVSGCDDFGVDWLKQLDTDQSLTVCVEILQEQAAENQVTTTQDSASSSNQVQDLQ